jgi:hypothetical protein
LQAAEMKFMGKTAGFTLFDHKRNEERLEKLKAKPVSNLFRIIVPIGKITLKEWTLIESQTNF